MPRYIIIDSYSGYIWGDTADMPRAQFDGSFNCGEEAILAACADLDASIGSEARTYNLVSSFNRSALKGRSGYFVYRADIDGSDAVAIIHDGQDQETIKAVERDCRLVGVVAFE